MNAVGQARNHLRSVPLRIKLVAAVLALVAAALMVISTLTTYFLYNYLVDQVDAQLITAGGIMQEHIVAQRPVQVTLPSDYVVAVATRQGVSPLYYDDRGQLGPGDLPEIPADLSGFVAQRDEPFTVRALGGSMRWRMLYTPLPNGQSMVVGQPLTDVDRAVRQLIWIDVLVGSAVLILLASLGAAIVRASLKPLVQIERTAAAIAGGDLTRRVPDFETAVPEPRSELGRLARALNSMLAQIEAAFTARAASETAARAAESSARDAAVAAQRSETRARRSEERMRQFIADASHELRTPLTTIRGFAELYRQGAASTPEDVGRLVRRIEDEAARMGLLVEDLLLLARLDRERPLRLELVELPVLAHDAVQAARAVAPQRRIALEIDRGSGPFVVYGDDARLRQVLGNLLTNALNHTPAEAEVIVRLREETGDTAVLEVVDTGPGLSSEQAERVFERFYRVDAARTRRTGGVTGTGLGLAIVAALVTAHNGQVGVDQTPGGGSTFRVRLPLARSAADAVEE